MAIDLLLPGLAPAKEKQKRVDSANHLSVPSLPPPSVVANGSAKWHRPMQCRAVLEEAGTRKPMSESMRSAACQNLVPTIRSGFIAMFTTP